jgi:hypothetical protein
VKCSPTRKLVKTAPWEQRKWLRRWRNVSNKRAIAKKLDVSHWTIVKNDFKLKPYKKEKVQCSENYRGSLGTLVMTTSFPTKNYFCCETSTTNTTIGFILFPEYSMRKNSSATIPKCIQSHILENHFEKRQVILLLFIESGAKINQDY